MGDAQPGRSTASPPNRTPDGALPIGQPAPPAAQFADLEVGMALTFAAPGDDLVAAHLATRPCEQAQLTSIAWSALAPRPSSGGTVSTTVTRWRQEATAGLLHTETFLVDESEREIEQARAVWHVPVTGSAGSGARVAWDVASPGWTARIAERLDNPDFRSATEAFDGSIGIAAGDVQTYFRIYRGAVIEAGRKPVDGATFTVHATESTWIGMLAARRSDYVRRAGKGQFTSSGSSFQYLRMFKAIMLILDAARTEVRETADA